MIFDYIGVERALFYHAIRVCVGYATADDGRRPHAGGIWSLPAHTRGYGRTFAEVAARLSITRRGVEKWVREGRLPVVRIGTRTPRIAEADLAEFIQQRREVRPVQ